jgi:hypothetical protein
MRVINDATATARPINNRTPDMGRRNRWMARASALSFVPPEAISLRAFNRNAMKENVMNEDLQLEIVDLGDAKEETKGRIQGVEPELNEAAPYKP